MKHLLQLATLTIDLEDVGEIEQQGENFLILFGPDHVPEKILITDLDAVLLREHLQQEHDHAVNVLFKEGLIKKKLYSRDKPPILDKPPF